MVSVAQPGFMRLKPGQGVRVSIAFTPETRAILGALSASPTLYRIKTIDRLIRTLKTAGILETFDLFYILAAADTETALLNWVSPGTRDLTATNSPTFTADRGYTGNGSTSFLSPGVALTALSNFSVNSANLGVWGVTNVAENATIIGPNGLTTVRINPRTAGDALDSQINDGASLSKASIGTSIGHSAVNRSGAAVRNLYKNGASVANDTQAATAVPGNALRILAGGSTFSTVQCAAAHVGSSLSSDQMIVLYGALLAYMQSVGAA